MQKIETPHFSIAFDKRTMNQAQRIANTLETIYKPVSRSLGIYPGAIRLWLNNQSAEANSCFSSPPRQLMFSNFYPANPYFCGNADFISLLCIHEFRHVVQHSIQYHYTPFLLKPFYFWGNTITCSGVPSFFSEGDAVCVETALTKSGRGRFPGWEKLYKVNLLERKPISFGKQLFGSYQHRMPGIYRLGYYFCTHIRKKYGAQAIRAIYEKSVRRVPFFGFYNAIKEVTKKSVLEIYKEMNQELLWGWQKQLEGLSITPATHITIQPSADTTDPIDYIKPFMDVSGNLKAWKKGLGVRPQLVSLSPHSFSKSTALLKKASTHFQETRCCFTRDILAPAAFDIGQGCAAWLESCLHPWQGKTLENRTYNYTVRLQYYDFKSKKNRTLTKNCRYNALAISPNTAQLVAVEVDKGGTIYLVILETQQGRVLKKIDNAAGGYYLTPSWCDEAHIVAIHTKEGQNSIVRINVHTDKVEILLPYSYEHRNSPKIYKDYLLYNSSYNGIDNIYAMHLPTKHGFQVTSRKYGAYLGMVDPVNHQLVFNDYTKDGMAIAVMPFDPLSWLPLERVEDRTVRHYETLVAQENNSDILAQVPEHVYPITNYNFWRDSLGFSSIALDEPKIIGGKVLLPELLSLQHNFKARPHFYHQFNPEWKDQNNEQKTSALGLDIQYQTCYPILNADFSFQRKLSVQDKTSWRKQLEVGIKFPYYFTLDSSSGETYLHISPILRLFDKGNILDYVQYKFMIKNAATSCIKDMHAPWSQQLDISYNHRFEHTETYSYDLDWNVQFHLFFPGIFPHHYTGLIPECQYRHYSKEHVLFPKSEILPKFQLLYGFPLYLDDWQIPLIWFLRKASFAVSYAIQPAGWINKLDNLRLQDTQHTITPQLTFWNGFLSIESYDPVKVLIAFPFHWKKDLNKQWKFSWKPKLECTLAW
ncbi:hypothetical protein [Candidatus Cardinium hertigii]|nr:hypothetical protein [Candidatus Cardinium hertigii]